MRFLCKVREILVKDNFLNHMYDMYNYLKPFHLPFSENPLGIWPIFFENRVEKFASDKGVSFSGVIDYSKPTKENIIDYIEEGLESDAPVAMLITINNGLNDTLVTQPNGHSWVQTSFNTHWVVITEIKTDEIAGTRTAKVSTWGGYSYLDLDTYYDREKVCLYLMYFK